MLKQCKHKAGKAKCTWVIWFILYLPILIESEDSAIFATAQTKFSTMCTRVLQSVLVHQDCMKY